MGLGKGLRRRRAAVASNLALALAAGTVVVLAVQADGYRAHEADLNDGGIWVTNSRDGFHGRINKPVGQLDAALFAKLETNLDVVQDGAAVVAVNLSDGLIAPIDPAEVRHPDGEEARVPGSADVQLAGGSLAVVDPATGSLWAQRVDPVLGLPVVTGLDQQAPPLAKTGKDASLAVTRSGDVLVASAAKDELARIEKAGGGFAKPDRQDLPADVGEGVDLSAVGDTPVVLDPATGELDVVGGGEASVEVGSVLQQPGPGADDVLVATSTSLLSVDLESGEVTTVAESAGGRPTRPVRLGACSFSAWSGGAGSVASVCGDEEPVVAQLGTSTSDLVFRVNRGEIVLNDRATGAVWNIESDKPARIDNWDAFRNKVREDDENEENEKEEAGDRRPPQAKPDDFGARPGRTTVLHPLDNDTAPSGRLLSVRSVQDVSNPDAEVTISPDGQTVQIRLPADAVGTTTFEYYIDDGRQDVSDHATVRVAPRAPTANAQPHLREGFEDRIWTVPSGGALDVPVLPDWRDNEDGDPLSVESATAVGGETSGAVARVTAAGRIRFQAPAKSGTVTVEYAVADGVGESEANELTFQVQGRKDRKAVAGVAEPDVVTGEVGQPIVIRPLDNDLPGSDPLTPTAELALAGKVAETGGAQVRTDLVEGEIQLRSDVARTFFLDYEAAYGNAPFAPGRIRVDVRASRRPPEAPVAMPDSLTLFGQSSSLVDVIANDIDPTGGMLVVTGAEAADGNQLDVAVVDGRWLRVSARQGELRPNPMVVRYTISNGLRGGVRGEVVVSQRPAPEDNTPVTETDRVTVRAGSGISIPVLDNDFSPSGDALTLVRHVAGEASGQLTVLRPGDEQVPTGQAFVAGRFVRYVAPPDLSAAQTFTVRYLAANANGESSPGKAEITVIPMGSANQLPEPPTLEGRVVSGDTVKLRMPGAGVDPDGDAVTLLGIDSAPRLGRIVRYGANSLHYQAYPGGAGTDEFSYRVTDQFGGVATGTVRVAVVQPGTPDAPLAVPDSMTVEPGRTAIVDVLANDLIAAGDRVTVELVDPPAGVSLESDTGPLLIQAPDQADGRNVEVVYTITNGISTAQTTVTLRTATPYNNPPVVFDAFGDAETGDTVTVDVLETAYDPDGSAAELRVTDVFAPAGVTGTHDDTSVTVARGREPIVVPFRVEDADGGAATASVYVPALDTGLPYVKADGVIKVDPGATVTAELADHVVNPTGGPVIFTLKERMWASPTNAVTARMTGETTFEVEAAEGYEGPGAVVFEVTTGTSVDDAAGRRAVLSVPVQVGDPTPILRCPTEPVEVAQAESIELDVAALCHVWTPEPEQADELSFTADWKASVDGLSIIEPEGSLIEVAADGSAPPNSEGVLALTSGGSAPAELRVRVVVAPPPSLAPIRIGDMKAGEERTLDLAPYLRAGVSDPVPTLVEVTQLTGLDVTATKEGPAGVRLTTGARVDGRAEFRVIMSDVAGGGGPERQVEGRIVLDILDVPDTPPAPVPGRTVRSQEVHLEWRAPEANGAPIDRYEVRGSGGDVTRCGSTSCDVTGLTNGTPYSFQVRAHNSVGWSDWSGSSARATPDAKPGIVGPIRLDSVGDRTLTISWSAPSTQTSRIQRYVVSWPGGTRSVTSPRVTITGLDNNKAYVFSVQAENALDLGPVRRSEPYQSVGTPGTPGAPTITDQQTSGDSTAVTVSWNGVDPNGPSPARYTVLRNGSPLPACTDITATSCDNAGIAYDGTRYTYAVRATNGGDKSSPAGPASSWSAVGKPAAWSDWSIAPTGANTTARATFTVPASRGAQSIVKVIVDGSVRDQAQRTGGQTVDVGVPDNDRSHTVQLQVCNESGACSDSSQKSVQTYGPLTQAHVISASSTDRKVAANLYEVRWTITVDTNGDPATVHVTSTVGGSSGSPRNETYQANGVDYVTVTTGWNRVDAENSEILRVSLSDGSPSRARTTTKDFRYNAPARDKPTVQISQGSACNDATSAPDCGGNPEPCVHASCARIRFVTANFNNSSAYCDMYDNATGTFDRYAGRSIRTNTTDEPGLYYGYPGRTVYAICNGVESNHYVWPSN